MSYLTIIILSLALSVDACVVSFSYGLHFTQNRIKNSLLLGLFTGIFQGIMPLIGYFLSGIAKSYIQPYSKIIILIIFLYLGLKFIKEAFDKDNEKNLCIDMNCLFLIGIATSIDAFSAGISLLLMGNGILKPALLIAFVTFVNANLGFWIGSRFKNMPTKSLEILAGILLILLGIKAVI